MKKIIATLIIITMLTSCRSKQVNKEHTSESSKTELDTTKIDKSKLDIVFKSNIDYLKLNNLILNESNMVIKPIDPLKPIVFIDSNGNKTSFDNVTIELNNKKTIDKTVTNITKKDSVKSVVEINKENKGKHSNYSVIKKNKINKDIKSNSYKIIPFCILLLVLLLIWLLRKKIQSIKSFFTTN